MGNLPRNLAIWAVIILVFAGLFNMLEGSPAAGTSSVVAYSDFMADVDSGNVSEVKIQNDTLNGKTKDGTNFSVLLPSGADIYDRLETAGVRVEAVRPNQGMPVLLSLLINWFPMLLLIGVWIFFMRQMQGGGGKAMGFGKSKAKLLNEHKDRVTFEDVAGIDEAKAELEEVVDFLRDPEKFGRLGGKIPKGVLLVGSPGTGKTLLAKAVAGEAKVPFFSISGSDFVEMFVGVGASRVRDMFETGKKNAPCLIFIDEIDAVGRHRGAGLGGGNDEREQTLNQMLVEMDGFEANEGVIIIAATNRPDVLDPALLRPGRFDRQVVVPNPDVSGRKRILEVHMKKVPLSPDVDADILARGTPGFSGADLANLVNEGALLAARTSKRVVSMADFEAAKDKVMMGAERRSLKMSEDERRLTAYHEAGHALVTIHSKHSDPIHKATIIPRGRALGLVMRLPVGDRLSLSRARLEADLAVAYGGRLAEELIFGAEMVTTGASSDIKMATDLARRMVTEWGMSEKLGAIAYAEPSQEVFLGYGTSNGKTLSDTTALTVDEEIRRIIDKGYETARRILTEHKDQLEAIAQGLLEFETLSGDEIKDLADGKTLTRRPTEPPKSGRTPTSTLPTGKAKQRASEAGSNVIGSGAGGLEPDPAT